MRSIAWRMERSYRRRLLDADLERCAALLAGRVLEVGAGRAGRRGAFRPPPSSTWVTLDRAADVRPHIRADAARLPFAEGSFDAVVCLEVLEYVADPGAVMRELARVVRRGGGVVVSVPFGHRQDTATDRWRVTGSGLRALASEAGLAVSDVRAQGGALTVVANTLKQMAWRSAPPLRYLLAVVVLPLGEILVRADGLLRDRSFTTGHLLVATRAT